MDKAVLKKWLSKPRTELIAAVVEGIRQHVDALNSSGASFYGYAIHPGDPFDIERLVAVTNDEENIEVPSTDDQYSYFRYSVDEWGYWQHDGFVLANEMLVKENAEFAALHGPGAGTGEMDQFEIEYSDALLEAILAGLETAKNEGVFGISEPFLTIWISDDEHPIVAKSVKRLNSKKVAKTFMAEFG